MQGRVDAGSPMAPGVQRAAAFRPWLGAQGCPGRSFLSRGVTASRLERCMWVTFSWPPTHSGWPPLPPAWVPHRKARPRSGADRRSLSWSASWPAFSGSCPGASLLRAPSWVRAPGHAPAFQLQRWRPWGSRGAERSQLSLVIQSPFSGQTGKRTFLCGFTVDCVCAEDFSVIFGEVRR